MSNESMEKLKNLFENQNKYETDVFVKITEALVSEVGKEAVDFLGKFIASSGNTMIIPRLIAIMSKYGDNSIINPIVSAMKEKSTPGICRETANALGTLGTRAAKDALELLYEIKLDPVMKELFKRKIHDIVRVNPVEYVWMPNLLLGKKSASQCIDAARSLARIAKEKAVPNLLEEILNNDLLIRAVIVTALGDIGSDDAVDGLFGAFRESYDEIGKKNSYDNTLEEIRTLIPKQKAEERVLELIDTNAPEKLKTDINNFLQIYKSHIGKQISIKAEELLDKGIGGITEHLISILCYQPYKGDEEFNRAIDNVLKETEIQANEHNKIMTEVILSVGKILEKSRAKENEIKDFLILEAEKLTDEELKARAIEILGSIPGEDIIDKLLSFTEDPSWKIREKAVYSLGEIGNTKAIEVLKKSCGDMHQNVSAAAMEALGKIDEATVLGLFKSDNWRIKKLALQVARTFDNPNIIEATTPLLRDDKYDVAFEAIDTMGNIKTEESIAILSEIIKKDGPAKLQEKVLEKLESVPCNAVLNNLVDALAGEIPLQLFANILKTLLNVMSSADCEVEYSCVKKIKDISIAGLEKRDLKVRLNAVALASELRSLKISDYKDIIEHLKEFDNLKSSRNPQEKAIVMAAENSKAVLEKKIKDIEQLEEGKNKIESLQSEIFDRNEMRSKNAIAEIWKAFSTTDLSNDAELKKKIWEWFSKRFLMPETSPYTRESLAKIFGSFNEPKAVPLLLKFKDSKVHAERLAVQGALKILTETFSKEEIVSASMGKSAPPAQPQAPKAPAAQPQAPTHIMEDIEYKILIIDDALVMRNLYSKLLKNKKFITDTAKNGVEAFEKIKNSEYDIALIDLKLPDLSGLDLLKQLQQTSKNKKIKSIIISSYLDAENTRQAIDLGAAEVFAKPVNIDMLATKIRVVLR